MNQLMMSKSYRCALNLARIWAVGLLGTGLSASVVVGANSHLGIVANGAAVISTAAPSFLEQDLSEAGSWLFAPDIVRSRSEQKLWELGGVNEVSEGTLIQFIETEAGEAYLTPIAVDPDSSPAFDAWDVRVLGVQSVAIDSSSTSMMYEDPESGDHGVVTLTLQTEVSLMELDAPMDRNGLLGELLVLHSERQSALTGEIVATDSIYVDLVELHGHDDLTLQYGPLVSLRTGEFIDEESGQYIGPMGPWKAPPMIALNCASIRNEGTLPGALCACWRAWNGTMATANNTLNTCLQAAAARYLLLFAGCSIACFNPAAPVACTVCTGVAFAALLLERHLCYDAYRRAFQRARFWLNGCFRANMTNGGIPQSPILPPEWWDLDQPPLGLRPSELEEYRPLVN